MSKQPPKSLTTRKHKSGAQKRKERAHREAVSKLAAYESESVPVAFSATPAHDDLQELPVYGVPAPKYVAAVEGILRELEQGVFTSAAQLADSMLRDDRVYATLGVRINGLMGSKLDLEPALDNDRARSIKEDAEECFAEMLPLTQLGELLRWGLLIGVGVAQILWERDGKTWSPTIKVWHPKHLRFDWSVGKYKLVTANQGEIVIERDDPQWIVHEPYGPRGWLRCLMRAIVMPWLVRSWARSWFARYAEVHGSPIRAGIIPAERDSADEKRFLSQLQTLGHEASIRLPQGVDGNKFDVKLIEAVGRSTETFQALLQHCDDSIAIAVLGQRQSTTGQGGLGSQENAGDSVRIDLKRSDALIGDCLREQFLKQWAASNYGAEDLAPYIRWQVDPPEDLQKKALELSTLMDALTKAPAEVDKRAVLESFNVPLLDEAEMPPDMPGTPDSGPDSKDEVTDAPEDDTADAQPEKLSARITKLSEAAKEGDAYSLALAGNAKKLAAKALGPDLQKVQAAIEASTSPADLRERLSAAYAGMDQEHLAEIVQRALVMAKLSGIYAAQLDARKK